MSLRMTDHVIPEPDYSWAKGTSENWQRARKLITELKERRNEALRLYRPLPRQEEFHRSIAWERVLVGSNRGGKTTPGAIETAWVATGTHPYLKFPKTDLRIFCVAKDQKKISEVFYRKLFRYGAFKIIRDLRTGEYRAFDPVVDSGREKEAEPAPPLIPRRLIHSISWESKKDNIWSKVILTNGNELSAYPSGGPPPNGVDVDFVWFDEEITHRDWYPEMAMRLLDREGRFIWTATPQDGSEALYDLYDKARDELLQEKPRVACFHVLLADNPHIRQEQKDIAASKFENNPDEYRVRILGEFALTSYRVYPNFDMHVHGFDMKLLPGTAIPEDWTKYVSIDPGINVCAVLFGAVPPPESIWRQQYGIKLLIYDELYIRNCDAVKFGQAMFNKCAGQRLQRFIIDAHGAKPRNAGTGISTEHYYREALAQRKVESIETGSGFYYGSDDIKGRVSCVRLWMNIMDRHPWLRVAKGRVPNFEYEIGRYFFKRVEKRVTDDPDYRKDAHLMADLEYMVADNPQWVAAPPAKKPESPVVAAFRKMMEKKRKGQRSNRVSLGPGSGHRDYR